MVDFGTDIDSAWEVSNTGDLKLVSGTDNAAQAVTNRLTTNIRELEWAYGEEEPYGTESDDMLGETDLETARATIELYDALALLEDPRVEDITSIQATMTEPEVCIVEINVQFIEEDNSDNIIIKHEV